MSSFIIQLKTSILSWLLFHANKGSNNKAFYLIKNELLERYAILLRFDCQEISGKPCYSCNGTGTFRNEYKAEFCYNCLGSGLYKKPFWTLLGKYYFGGYYFHSPLKKLDEKPVGIKVDIEGYIRKQESDYTLLSRLLLGMYYGLDKKTILNGDYINVYWAYKWFLQKNWLRSWLYIFSYKRFPPLANMLAILKRKIKVKEDLELPF